MYKYISECACKQLCLDFKKYSEILFKIKNQILYFHHQACNVIGKKKYKKG